MPCFKLINFNCQLQSENPHTLYVVVCLASQVTVFKVWLLGSAFHISASNQSAEMFPLCSHAWGFKNPFSTHEKKTFKKYHHFVVVPMWPLRCCAFPGPCFKVCRELATAPLTEGEKRPPKSGHEKMWNLLAGQEPPRNHKNEWSPFSDEFRPPRSLPRCFSKRPVRFREERRNTLKIRLASSKAISNTGWMYCNWSG